MNNKASITALMSAFGRAFHAENEEHPVFADHLAKNLMTEEEYAAARARLNDAIERSESMIYNLFDAAALPFGKRYRLKDAYTCVSFASYVLGMDDVKDIGDLENRLSRNTVFEGGLNELIEKHSLTTPEGDCYYERRGLIAAARDLCTLVKRLMLRRKCA